MKSPSNSLLKSILIACPLSFGGMIHANDSLEAILKGLQSQSLEERKKSRESLEKFNIPATEEKTARMILLFKEQRSPEVRFALKRTLMHRLFGKGFLGVRHQGAVVQYKGKRFVGRTLTEVNPGGPAEVSGLKAGDVVLKVGKEKPTEFDQRKAAHQQVDASADAFSASIKSFKPGSKVPITILRAGKMMTMEPILASYQKYIQRGENLEAFLMEGTTVDRYGFTEKDNAAFEALMNEL